MYTPPFRQVIYHVLVNQHCIICDVAQNVCEYIMLLHGLYVTNCDKALNVIIELSLTSAFDNPGSTHIDSNAYIATDSKNYINCHFKSIL